MKLSKGIMGLILSTGILIMLSAIIFSFIQFYFRNTAFFIDYLSISKKYTLGIFSDKMILLLCSAIGIFTFLTLSYKKLFTFPDFPFRKSQFLFFGLSVFFLSLQYFLKYLIASNDAFFSQAPLLWGLLRILLYVISGAFLLLAAYGLECMKHLVKYCRKEIIISSIFTLFFFVFLTITQLI